ncbi:MAG: peptide chain release factor 1 [Candidatus Eiseniibacteriota bacterium]
MNERARRALARFREIEELLSTPEVASNIAKLRDLGRERAELEELAKTAAESQRIEQALSEAREVVAGDDAELRQLAEAELEELSPKLEQLEQRLRVLSVPKDPDDSRNAIVEVRAGTGGNEAALFAAEIVRMYLRYADRKGWKTETLETSETEIGGVKEAIFSLQGEGAFGIMRWESGVHRVQRVPVTEAGGRIHTSAVSVAVLPEAEEIEVVIDPAELRIDVYRSQGPGGQSVNTTDSAVRITHIPTGLVVTCQDEKSQHKNKAKALRVLRSRLLEQQRETAAAERAEARRSQIGTGDRSEKIRTYNFPQNRVTDHRIGFTIHDLTGVLEGELDPLVDAVRERVVEQLLTAGDAS